MQKKCVVLNGQVINIGEWDYQITIVNGEQVAQNPLPDGATVEDKEVGQDEDGGWFVVGTTKPKTPDQLRIEQLTLQSGDLLFRLAQAQTEMNTNKSQTAMMLLQIATIQGGI